MRSSELLYPQLSQCQVSVRGNGAIAQPPVRLSASCLAAAQDFSLPPLYDFETGQSVGRSASPVRNKMN